MGGSYSGFHILKTGIFFAVGLAPSGKSDVSRERAPLARPWRADPRAQLVDGVTGRPTKPPARYGACNCALASGLLGGKGGRPSD